MSTQDNRSEKQKLITALSELQKKYKWNPKGMPDSVRKEIANIQAQLKSLDAKEASELKEERKVQPKAPSKENPVQKGFAGMLAKAAGAAMGGGAGGGAPKMEHGGFHRPKPKPAKRRGKIPVDSTKKDEPKRYPQRDPNKKYDRHGRELKYDDQGNLIQTPGLGGSLLTQKMIDEGYTADDKGFISGPKPKRIKRKKKEDNVPKKVKRWKGLEYYEDGGTPPETKKEYKII